MAEIAVKNAPDQGYVASVPGSKSYTNRALILAAQRIGRTRITGGLHCDDTIGLARALSAFGGLHVETTEDGFVVERTLERLEQPDEELDMGAAGTPARFMLSFVAASGTSAVVTGTPRLCERPMGDILTAFDAIGVRYDCLGEQGCLPVRVHASEPATGEWPVRGAVSSQFTSALLLFAAQQRSRERVVVSIVDGLVSRPYVEMTVAMMRECGIDVEALGGDRFAVTPASPSVARIAVETDASGMSYFLAAAALTQTSVVIPGIGRGSAQGDLGLVGVLAEMGCQVDYSDSSVRLTGAPLRGITVDMDTMPDTVLTVAAIAPFASSPTRIENIGNLRVKECDRIYAAARELERMGVLVEEGGDYLVVHPCQGIRPATIHTYDDHRVAMAFAIPGLVLEGVEIEDPSCVTKSFPRFWSELRAFHQHQAGQGCALEFPRPLGDVE